MRWLVRLICVVLWLLSLQVMAAILLFNNWNHIAYQRPLERALGSGLQKIGIRDVRFKIERLDHKGLVMRQLQLGPEYAALKADYLALVYRLPEIFHGYVQKVQLDGLRIAAYQAEGKWFIEGLEALMQHPLLHSQKSPGDPSEKAIAFDFAALQQWLPAQAAMQNLQLSLRGSNWHAETNAQIAFSRGEAARLDIQTSAITAQSGKIRVNTGVVKVTSALMQNVREWKGVVQIPDIKIAGAGSEIPLLHLSGAYQADPELLQAQLEVKDSDLHTQADIRLRLPYATPEQGLLLIKQFRLPWGGGNVQAADVRIPLAFEKPIRIPVTIRRLELGTLLNLVSNGKVQGTGRISGKIPVLYYPDGRVGLQQGEADSLGGGTLTASPEALPAGGNAQVDMVRQALQNFQYDSLKILVSSTAGGKSEIRLKLQGKNPEVFGDRPVNLNVSLSGDLMPLLQQSILPMGDIRQLLHMQDTP